MTELYHLYFQDEHNLERQKKCLSAVYYVLSQYFSNNLWWMTFFFKFLTSRKPIFYKIQQKYITKGAPGWLNQLSVLLLVLAQGLISESWGFWDQAPHQVLHPAWSLLEILSTSISITPPLFSPSLSFKTKQKPKS